LENTLREHICIYQWSTSGAGDYDARKRLVGPKKALSAIDEPSPSGSPFWKALCDPKKNSKNGGYSLVIILNIFGRKKEGDP